MPEMTATREAGRVEVTGRISHILSYGSTLLSWDALELWENERAGVSSRRPACCIG